jgi:hypothetical protein
MYLRIFVCRRCPPMFVCHRVGCALTRLECICVCICLCVYVCLSLCVCQLGCARTRLILVKNQLIIRIPHTKLNYNRIS